MPVHAPAERNGDCARGKTIDATRPVEDSARIDALDVLRGVAVLGILLMNVVGFGLPQAYVDPTVFGGATGADLWTWIATSVFFEGTMRGLFTLLFGASVVLFTTRAEQADLTTAADLHVRRMLWLIAFGFVNSHVLLWAGDILFEYGLVGLFLYAFRKARPRTLLVIAASGFAMLLARGLLDAQELQQLRANAAEAVALQSAEATLTESQQASIDGWNERLAEMKPPPEKIQTEVDAMRDGFWSAWQHVTSVIQGWRTVFMYEYAFLESFSTMLIGVALFSLGALQGRWSTRRYVVLTLAGYGLGLTINVLETASILRSGFDPVVVHGLQSSTYELGRLPTTLGHVGLVLLLWRSEAFAAAFRRLAAVGRMAFTNYLTQSLICSLLFTGVGFGLYGQLARHQLYYVVVAIWIVQLLWSPWWLARFRYGPLEWLWRSLTYRAWQPFRRDAEARPAQPV
jgi:uncharacterized protein